MSEGTRRLFFALPLSAAARGALESHLARVPGGLPGRLVPPESWHLTLRFLGELDVAAARAVQREVEGAVLGPPFSLELGGWGAFPRPDRARVLWLGVTEGEEPLRELANRVETAVRAAGLPAERRPFAAHLTLSRLRQPADVRPALAAVPPFAAQVAAGEVVLFHSRLGHGPARYEAVTRIPLR
jgi:2'-5' RNA ligase